MPGYEYQISEIKILINSIIKSDFRFLLPGEITIYKNIILRLLSILYKLIINLYLLNLISNLLKLL